MILVRRFFVIILAAMGIGKNQQPKNQPKNLVLSVLALLSQSHDMWGLSNVYLLEDS